MTRPDWQSAPRRPRAAWCILLAVLFGGCATHSDRLREIRQDFYAGNPATAIEKIDRYAKRYQREADVLKLDRAVIELCTGRPREAERILREVRDSFDALEQKNLAEPALVMLTDDTTAAYPGEDYEKVLIRAMLALANLMGDGDDAAAYGLQVIDAQERIIQAGADPSGKNPKLAYKRVALGAYIHGLLREETLTNYDDAARGFARVVSWEPEFPFGQRDVERATHGRHSAPGNGVLYAFVLVGRGPLKVETVELGSTVASLIGDRVLSHNLKHTLPPTIAPIKVPKVVLSPNFTHSVWVSVDGQPAGATATITDVGRLAAQQYEAIYPDVLLRAVLRRAAKKGIVYGAKEGMGVANNSLVNLAMDLGGVAWEASESADTRCWGLLPDQIQVLRVELPVGEHRVALRPDSRLGSVGPDQGAKVSISDGRNTYLLANIADGRLIGSIVTSRK
jgi:uncharacterized protein